MSARQQADLARSSQHPEGPICSHCAGVTVHETWCITCNPVVYYAFRVACDGSYLTPGDAIILHALGVDWSDRAGSPTKAGVAGADVVGMRTRVRG